MTYSPLYFGDEGKPFYWNGDTAWSAPGFEASNMSALWGGYIQDRAQKGFNVVLVAPAAIYKPFPANNGPLVQVAARPGDNCSSRIPNDCSTPNRTYWNRFDELISTANLSGIVPVIGGLVHPVDDNTLPTQYPCQKNAVAYARFLAARLAGYAALFSPGFDDRPSNSTSCGESVLAVMNAIGTALKTGPNPATPRALLGNHLGGGATCSDYQAFRDSGWMTLFLFQSGHAISLGSPDPASICPKRVASGETSVPAALRRSWQMPWTLTSPSAQPPLPSYNTGLPSFNGEGPYDNVCLQTSGCTCGSSPPGWCAPNSSLDPSNNYGSRVDVRYHVRQAAFESLFSGAYGFTYGVQEIGHWYFGGTTAPAAYPITFEDALAGPAARDMTSLFNNFNTRAGLFPHREWIVNNGSDSNTDGNYKKALASDGTSLVLAYMPAGGSNSIQISTSSLPGLSCSANGWTATWLHAQNNQPSTSNALCSGTNPLEINKPDGTECSQAPFDQQACDWVLQIEKTGSASLANQSSSLEADLQTWADLSSGDGTSAILARLRDRSRSVATPVAAPTVVSAPGLAFQQSPRVTRVGSGYLVVWQADGLDGSMLGVFGQRLDERGQPTGARLQINTTARADQGDPAIDSSPAGDAVVVWSSYGQDGDRGGIYGRMLGSSGISITSEFRVNAVTRGHQESPQVACLPGGRFVVAWQTRAAGGDPGTLSLRLFTSSGMPATDEIRLPSGVAGIAPRLIDLLPTASGGVRLRWRSRGAQPGAERLSQMDLTANGDLVGPVAPLE